ncbi:hypothetical protein [Candidatus Contubernalis alkaliaceticus]|nr:hypothetical protein [Candidatus Contubernalis alkalaceticus]
MKHKTTVKASKEGYIQVLERIMRKTLVYGEKHCLPSLALSLIFI